MSRTSRYCRIGDGDVPSHADSPSNLVVPLGLFPTSQFGKPAFIKHVFGVMPYVRWLIVLSFAALSVSATTQRQIPIPTTGSHEHKSPSHDTQQPESSNCGSNVRDLSAQYEK